MCCTAERGHGLASPDTGRLARRAHGDLVGEAADLARGASGRVHARRSGLALAIVHNAGAAVAARTGLVEADAEGAARGRVRRRDVRVVLGHGAHVDRCRRAIAESRLARVAFGHTQSESVLQDWS
jgi:hypothetical protein